jgi:hypothetical protein
MIGKAERLNPEMRLERQNAHWLPPSTVQSRAAPSQELNLSRFGSQMDVSG